MNRRGSRALKLGLALLTFGMVLAILTGAVVVGQPELPHPVIVWVDDRPAGSVRLRPGAAGELVDLGALARALGWRLQSAGKLIELSGEGRPLELTAGSTRVREGRFEDAPLSVAPSVVDGTVYIALADVAGLFYVRTKLEGNRLRVSTATIDADAVTVTEVKLPPQPSPTPAKIAAPPPPAPQQQAASISLALNELGSQRFFQFGITSNVPTLRSNLVMLDSNQLSPPSGSVTVGPLARNLTFGTNTDPLSGIILRTGSLSGVDAYDRNSGTDVVAGRRNAGQNLVGWSRRRGTVSESVAMLMTDGRLDQVLARRTYETRHTWGEVDRELLVGTKGAGAGIYVRTNGRTFYEGTATFATRGLPLQNNDAPLQLDIARRLSQNVTLRAGFIAGYALKAVPFTSISARDRDMTFSASLGGGDSQIGAAYVTNRFSGQLFVGGGIGGRSTFLSAATSLGPLTVNLQSLETASSRDTTLELQTQGRAVNLLAGVEDVGSTKMHVGPVVGLSVPLFSGLAAQVAFNPTAAGDNIRVGLVASFKARNRPTIRSDRVVLTVSNGEGAGPLTLAVDGAPGKTFTGSTLVADITDGPHVISVETADGSRGSPDVRLDVHRGAALTVALVPVRTVRGHVRIDAPAAEIPDYFSLAGTTVLLQPWGQIATVDANGSFVFFNLAIDPGSTLVVDPNTLPPDLKMLAAVPVPDSGPAELVLVPTKKIEQHYFPAK